MNEANEGTILNLAFSNIMIKRGEKFSIRIIVSKTYHSYRNAYELCLQPTWCTRIIQKENDRLIHSHSWPIPKDINKLSILPFTKEEIGRTDAHARVGSSKWGNNLRDWFRISLEQVRCRFPVWLSLLNLDASCSIIVKNLFQFFTRNEYCISASLEYGNPQTPVFRRSL